MDAYRAKVSAWNESTDGFPSQMPSNAGIDVCFGVSLNQLLYKLRSVQNTGTCYPGQGWFDRNLGWGYSPGVPDKSSRGLGSMSRYSAQILICFIAHIFLICFIPLWVWLGTLQDYQYAQCPVTPVHVCYNDQLSELSAMWDVITFISRR